MLSPPSYPNPPIPLSKPKRQLRRTKQLHFDVVKRHLSIRRKEKGSSLKLVMKSYSLLQMIVSPKKNEYIGKNDPRYVGKR